MWLGRDQDHYYVLSRFLISRMLTVTKLPPLKAVKIALELKKHLVDGERLNLTQVCVQLHNLPLPPCHDSVRSAVDTAVRHKCCQRRHPHQGKV